MKQCQSAFFLVFVNFPSEEVVKFKAEISKILEGTQEEPQLNSHIDYTDHKAIIDHFKLNEQENKIKTGEISCNTDSPDECLNCGS